MKRPSEIEAEELTKKAKSNSNSSPIDIDSLPPEKQLSLKVREKKQLVRVFTKLFNKKI